MWKHNKGGNIHNFHQILDLNLITLALSEFHYKDISKDRQKRRRHCPSFILTVNILP